jgi:hypothetical protein
MNITNLVRGANGKLRPARPEPTSIPEAEAYAVDKKTADEANLVLDIVEKKAEEFKALDNTEKDFNSQAGVVITSGEPASKQPGDKLKETTSLAFDPETGVVQSFEQHTEGTVNRVLKAGNFGGYTLNHSSTISYRGDEEFNLNYQAVYRKPNKPNESLQEDFSLIQNGDGTLAYGVKVTDSLTQ